MWSARRIFSSSVSVGGFKLPILYNADMSDGMMEVMLVKKPKNPVQAFKIVTTLLSRKKDCPYVIFKKSTQIHFSSPKEVTFTVDGEFDGDTKEVDISMIPHAISMIVNS